MGVFVKKRLKDRDYVFWFGAGGLSAEMRTEGSCF
jgi:hypothetical protein